MNITIKVKVCLVARLRMAHAIVLVSVMSRQFHSHTVTYYQKKRNRTSILSLLK
jgi:hypothetical protein